nr:DUF3265 domain-containing protein [Vibrio diabolicus]
MVKNLRTNKQFKWDSARVAFLACVGVEEPCSDIGIACFTP